MKPEAGLNEDFLDMLHSLVESGVEFLVVGAHAMAVHGIPRATGDLDILVRPTPENADRVLQALRLFGAPLEAHGVAREDFTAPGNVYQVGLPPRRIDLMTGISGVDFETARASQVVIEIGSMGIPFLGLDALRRNKTAAGRDKDLVDLELLSSPDDEE
jgi:hypothetical protein